MSVYDRQPGQHGTRKQYQRGCRCSRCRRAEATYRGQLRTARARGQRPLGARVPAGPTWKRIRQMLPEFGGERGLAQRLGLKRRKLRFEKAWIRLQTAHRVDALYAATMPEDLDAAFELDPLRQPQ